MTNGTSKYDGLSPVVDLERLCLRENPSEDDFLRVGKEIVKAFEDYGYTYLKNHGFSKDKFKKICYDFDKFYDLDIEEKIKFRRDIVTLDGYSTDKYEEVKHSHKHVADRESYDYRLVDSPFPDIPGLEQSFLDLVPSIRPFGKKIMKAIGQGLGVPDNLFEKYHDIFGPKNRTGFRVLRYKPILEEKEDQIRFQEHIDRVIIVTLQMYADMEGFQIQDKAGEWRDIEISKEDIVMFPSMDFQKWTGDKIKGANHRVVVPKDEAKRILPRRCFIVFLHADDDVLVETLDGSNKYPAKTVRQLYKENVSYFAKDFKEYEDKFEI